MMSDNGHARQADNCDELAAWLDARNIPGSALILSRAQASRIQVALEDAASAHRDLIDTPTRAEAPKSE